MAQRQRDRSAAWRILVLFVLLGALLAPALANG
jgi:hypothetical protein